jgi:hypothetical protein
VIQLWVIKKEEEMSDEQKRVGEVKIGPSRDQKCLVWSWSDGLDPMERLLGGEKKNMATTTGRKLQRSDRTSELQKSSPLPE